MKKTKNIVNYLQTYEFVSPKGEVLHTFEYSRKDVVLKKNTVPERIAKSVKKDGTIYVLTSKPYKDGGGTKRNFVAKIENGVMVQRYQWHTNKRIFTPTNAKGRFNLILWLIKKVFGK